MEIYGIHIQMSGVKLGPYSERQVRQYLEEGILMPTDLARRDGTENWEAVLEVLAKLPAAPVPEKPPVDALPPEAKPDTVLPPPAASSPATPSRAPAVPESSRPPEISTPVPKKQETVRVARALILKSAEKQTTRSTRISVVQAPPLLGASPSTLPPVSPEKLPEKVETATPLPVKVIPRKTEPDAKKISAPSEPLAASSVPIPAAKFEMATTSPLMPSAVKVLLKKTDPDAKPAAGAPASTQSESFPAWSLPATPAKAPEKTGTSLASVVKALTKKADPVTSTPAAGSDPLLLPAVVKILPKQTGAVTPSGQTEAKAAAPVAPPSPVQTETKVVAPVTAPLSVQTETKAVAPVTVPSPVRTENKMAAPVIAPSSVQTETKVVVPATDKSATTVNAGSPPRETRPSPVRPILYGMAAVIIGAVLLGAIYVGLAFSASNSLRNALNSGNQDQLESAIDFPAVRESLKKEMEAQLAKSGAANNPNQEGSPSSAVLSMIKNSIDFYVTPVELAALVNKPDHLAAPDQLSTVSGEEAEDILLALNSQQVRNQGFASFNDFVVSFDMATFHLRFYTTGWKLNRIELSPDLQLPTLPASPGAPTSSNEQAPPFSAPVVKTYLEQGFAKYQKGEMDAAIIDFTQALAIDPKATVAYINRGSARQAKKDFAGAILDYTQAITLDPKLATAYYSRADAKSANKDIEGALADYTQAIDLDPKLAGAYYSRGNILTGKNDYDGAIADYTQALAIDPTQANAYSNRGLAHAAKNDLDAAIADYNQALAIDPKLAIAYYNRGYARQAQGNVDAAILDFNQALDLDPKMARVYYNRGNAKSTKHDVDGAIADYNQALVLDPTIAPAYCYRGEAKQAKGDLDGALADYTQTLTLDPKIAVAYYNRGLIKEQKNDLDGAIADSSQALNLDPKYAQAYYNRGFAKLTKGNLDGASEDLKKFCEFAPRDHYADHARLYLWLIAKAHDAGTGANQELINSLQNDWNSAPEDLVSMIAGFLLDRIGEADLVAASASTDVKKDQGQHCEVWYFIGMKRLLSGDRTTSVDYFRKCLTTGEKDYCEYILAQAELHVLEPGSAN